MMEFAGPSLLSTTLEPIELRAHSEKFTERTMVGIDLHKKLANV
jgi:hypothetical protein